MAIVTRQQWGARAPNSNPTAIAAVGTAAHWEGPHMGSFGHDQCAGKVRGIQAFHMDTRKWADIAYSAVVCPHGVVFLGRGKGARTAANGTNTANNSWHAVCYLGGEGDPFTDAAKQGFLVAHDHLGGGRWSVHSDHFSTECPGDVIRAWVRAGAATPGTAPTPPPPIPEPEEIEMRTIFIAQDPEGKGMHLFNAVQMTRQNIGSPEAVADLRYIFDLTEKDERGGGNYGRLRPEVFRLFREVV